MSRGVSRSGRRPDLAPTRPNLVLPPDLAPTRPNLLLSPDLAPARPNLVLPPDLAPTRPNLVPPRWSMKNGDYPLLYSDACQTRRTD